MTIPSPALTEELTLRWNKLQQLMHESHADGLLISDNVNLFYVSGHIFRGYCYLPATGLPIFLVRRPLGWEGPQIVYIRKPEDIRDYFTQHGIPFPETYCSNRIRSVIRITNVTKQFSPLKRSQTGLPYCAVAAASKPRMKSNRCVNRGNFMQRLMLPYRHSIVQA